MVITIDGLAVNGKSTLAKKLAEKLKFEYLNTGNIYRSIALFIMENKIDVTNINLLVSKINKIEINFHDNQTYLNQKNITKKIRSEEISQNSTKWAVIPEIKEFVKNYQKKFIEKNNVIIEGRDIATRIAPNAEIKFYLYSDILVRATRLCKQNDKLTIKTAIKSIEKRDSIDINEGNFIKPKNSIEINVSNYTIEEVLEIMLKEINNKLNIKKVAFIGLSNKKDKEPFDITTNSGKIINEIIDRLNYNCYKLNLVPYAPIDKSGKLRYPTKKEINESIPFFKQEIDKIKPDCIVGFGRIVNEELKKINLYQNILICAKHPSYIYVYKRNLLDKYIEDLINEINTKINII